MYKNINVVFMGTPDFSVPVLKKLIEYTNVVLVVTQPDKEKGRKRELTMSPVKEVAIKNNIRVFQPIKIREDYELIDQLKPDLIVTCAYGQILPKALLDIPKYGSINVHASLLPKYRGAAPIQHALLNGDEETGVTLMYMDAGMDTGDMIAKSFYRIKGEDNVGALHDKLSVIGADLLVEKLGDIISGKANREKQNDAMATYAAMIKREDENIDINDNGKNIINKIRAFNPWPLAHLRIKDEEIKVVEARFEPQEKTVVGKVIITKNQLGIQVCDGIIYLDKIKPVGKKTMLVKDYLNGINKERLL